MYAILISRFDFIKHLKLFHFSQYPNFFILNNPTFIITEIIKQAKQYFFFLPVFVIFAIYIPENRQKNIDKS